jgi:hypothetical protein
MEHSEGAQYAFHIFKMTNRLVAHACNPSNSGGSVQEDHGSKPAWANSSMRPFLKKPFTKIALVEWLKVNDLR